MTQLNSASLFLQAEDGIRDGRVTGVQTCALPIYWRTTRTAAERRPRGERGRRRRLQQQIGRASCRGRGEISGVAGSLKKKTGKRTYGTMRNVRRPILVLERRGGKAN